MRIFCTFIFLLLGVVVYGQGIHFYHGSFDFILEKARKEKKQIFVDVYTSWCGPCKQMATQVFSDPEVGKFYNETFICVKLDAEKEKSHGFFEKYQAGGFPSLFWLTMEGELIDMNVGFMNSKQFLDKAKGLKDSKMVEKIKSFEERWNNGERNVELVDKYVFGYIAKVYPDKFASYCLDYLGSLDEEQLKTKHTYKILSCFNRNMQPGLVFDTQMKYWNEYACYEDYLSFNTKRYRWIVRGTNVKAMKSEEEFQKQVKLLQSVDFPQKEMYLAIIDAEADLRKDVNKGILAFDELVDKYGETQPFIYPQFAYSLLNAGYFISSNLDTTNIDRVWKITERAYELFPSKETAMYMAATYAKIGDYKNAYAVLGALPFLGLPMLSNALYPKLGIFSKPKTKYGRTLEGKRMREEVKQLMGKSDLN